MNKKKISIIIPCYNVSSHVESMINSVKRVLDTCQIIEPIIINDKSSDNTLEIIKKNIDNRFTLIENNTNVGVSKTRNNGINAAKGEYIFFLDGDDTLSKDFKNILNELSGDDFMRHLSSKKTMKLKNNFSLSVQPSSFITKRSFLINEKIVFEEGIIFEDNHFIAMIESSLERNGVEEIKCFNTNVFKYTDGREGSIMNSKYDFQIFYDSYERMKTLKLSRRTSSIYMFQLWNSFRHHLQNKNGVVKEAKSNKLKNYLKIEFKKLNFSKLPPLYKLRYISFKIFKKVLF